jgi:hypothetical protein
MKLTVIVLLTSFAAICSCNKENAIPGCVQAKIEAFKNSSCEHGASVKEYKFQGETVYTFNMGWCGADLPTGIINHECKAIGSLGGYTGNTNVNGVDFSTAIHIRTIWSR